MAKSLPPNNSPSSPDTGDREHLRVKPMSLPASAQSLRNNALGMPDADRAELLKELIRTLKAETRAKLFTEFNPTTPLNSRTLASVDYVYVIKLRQDGSEEAALVHLIHEKLLTEEGLKEMVDEAVKVTHESRYKAVRAQLAGKSLTAKPEDINASYFPSHVNFVQTVLIDRFGFKKLVLMGAQATIEPTIIIEGVANGSTETTTAEPADTNDRGS